MPNDARPMGTTPLDWATYGAAFEVDGSLRDLVVRDTTLTDWNHVLRVVEQHADTVSLTINAVEIPIPDDAQWLFDVRSHATTILRASLSEIVLCGYFFTPEEIELDLDPRAVTTAADAERLFAFMGRLAVALGKEVLLTAESVHHAPWFHASSIDGSITFTP